MHRNHEEKSPFTAFFGATNGKKSGVSQKELVTAPSSLTQIKSTRAAQAMPRAR